MRLEKTVERKERKKIENQISLLRSSDKLIFFLSFQQFFHQRLIFLATFFDQAKKVALKEVVFNKMDKIINNL
jgi:hypothetical protein